MDKRVEKLEHEVNALKKEIAEIKQQLEKRQFLKGSKWGDFKK